MDDLELSSNNSQNIELNNNELVLYKPSTQSSCSLNDSKNQSLNNKSRRKSTFPFGKCKVCNDKATGVHYGISTCEGCKGFFKRSILRNEYYKCFFGNNCVLNPKNRNRCKACRFRKCIQAGMSFSGIKMGRIPKAEKMKAIESLKQTGEEVEDDFNDDDYDYNDDVQTNSSYNKRYEMRKELESNLAQLTSTILGNDYINPKTLKEHNSQENMMNIENQNNNHHHNDSPENSSDHNNNNNNNNNSENEDENENNLNVQESSSPNSLSDKTLSTLNTNNSSSNTSSSANTLDKKRLNKYEDYMTKFLSVLETSEEVNESQMQLIHSKTKSCDMFMRNLLDLHRPLKQSNILPITNYSQMFTTSFSQNDLSYHIISSLINDKIYQLYNTHSEKTYERYENAKMLIARGNMSILGDNNPDLSLEQVWSALVQSIPDFVKSEISFFKEVPGLNEINETDFANILNNKLFDFFVIMNSILFINDESYLYLPNDIHYTRYWMNKIKGKPTTDSLFQFVKELNDLNLTNKEKALFIVLVFTMPDLDVEDEANLQDLNEYYTRAILYEFDLNKRNSLFLSKFKNVLIKLKENRILQRND